MAVTDPIADMLARINNAHGAFHSQVKIPFSNVKASVADILKQEGYVSDYTCTESFIDITLKYADGKPLISGVRKISKPSRRVYVGAADIPRVQNGLGICIMSTSSGLLEGAVARERNVGGEVLCEVW